MTTRRRCLRAVGTVGFAGVAGCLGGGGNGNNTGDGGGTNTNDDATTTDSSTDSSESIDVTPWATYNADAERTRSTPDQLPDELNELASFTVPVRSGSGPNPIVTPEGVFLVGAEGSVFGLNHPNLETRFERSLSVQGGYVHDGTIVVTADGNVLGLGVVGGERQWVAGYEGRVFPTPNGVGITGGVEGVINPETGDLRWEKDLFREASIPPVHTGSETAFLNERADIVAVDTGSGEERWRFTREDSEMVPLAVQNETVFVYDEALERRALLALDRTDGTRRWRKTGGRFKTGSYRYATDSDGFYFWTTRDEIIALDPTDGTELWSTALVGGLQGVTTGVAANCVVYTTGDRIEVRSKANGDSKLSKEVDGANGVAIAGGRLYTTRTNSSADRILTVYGQE